VFFSRCVGHPVGSTRSTTWSLLPGSVRRRQCDFIIIIIIIIKLWASLRPPPPTSYDVRFGRACTYTLWYEIDSKWKRSQRLCFRFYVFISSRKVCVCVWIVRRLAPSYSSNKSNALHPRNLGIWRIDDWRGHMYALPTDRVGFDYINQNNILYSAVSRIFLFL